MIKQLRIILRIILSNYFCTKQVLRGKLAARYNMHPSVEGRKGMGMTRLGGGLMSSIANREVREGNKNYLCLMFVEIKLDKVAPLVADLSEKTSPIGKSTQSWKKKENIKLLMHFFKSFFKIRDIQDFEIHKARVCPC